MRSKILLTLLISLCLVGNSCDLCYYCDDESSSSYSWPKKTKETRTYSSVVYTDEWSWDGNTAVVTTKRNGIEQYQSTYTHNDYGYRIKSVFNDGNSIVEWEYDKWKVLSRKGYNNGSLSSSRDYEWDGLTRKFSEGDYRYEDTFDKYLHPVRRTAYLSDVVYDYTFEWDTSSRWRLLKMTDMNGNLYEEVIWSGNSNTYYRYDSNGSVTSTSTREVNEFDDTLIQTTSAYVFKYEYKSERFKPYY